MITGLVISGVIFMVWLVRYIRDYRATTRELRSFPGAYIADSTPPTRAEITGEVPQLNGGFLIPPHKVASYLMNGNGQKVWLNEYSDYRLEPARTTIYSAFSPANAQAGDVWYDTSDDIQYRANHIVRGASGWRLEPQVEPGCQHPNPEPVDLTTGEIVAAVCPDCLQPLPPSFVGSEWKP